MQSTDRQTARVLRLHRPGTEPGGTQGGTVPPVVPPLEPGGTVPDVPGGSVPVSVPPPGTEIVRMSGAARAGTAIANAARELWLDPGKLVHSLWNGSPGSMAGHYRYMTSREWVPESLEGKEAAFVAFAGLAYHILVGTPLLAFSKALGAAAVRPLRFLALAVPVFILVLLFVL